MFLLFSLSFCIKSPSPLLSVPPPTTEKQTLLLKPAGKAKAKKASEIHRTALWKWGLPHNASHQYFCFLFKERQEKIREGRKTEGKKKARTIIIPSAGFYELLINNEWMSEVTAQGGRMDVNIITILLHPDSDKDPFHLCLLSTIISKHKLVKL